MRILSIDSKKHGEFNILLDNEDYEKVTTIGRTTKWCARVCPGRHNLVYFQKRLSDNSLVEMHRLIMGFPKGKVVDHINGNTLDNRKNNLRVCTNATNIRKGKVRTNNKSGYSGIYIKRENAKRPWTATIKVNYKNIYLGSFITFNEALRARKIAENKYND